MITNERVTKSGFSPAQSLIMAVVFLLVGVVAGYVIRGFQPGMRKNASVVPPVQMPANIRQPIVTEQLKQLADQQSQPIIAKLKSNPKDAAALAQLGDLRYDSSQYKEAISYYEQSLALAPRNTRVRADMASAYAYLGNPDRAISEYQAALKFDPSHGLSLLNLGLVQWHDKGDAKAAVETWEKLIKVNPQFAQQAQVDQLIAQAKKHVDMPSQVQAEKPPNK